MLDWLADNPVDVLCLQELKLTDDKFPLQALEQAGYAHCAVFGQKTYNGVAVISRHPLSHALRNIQGLADEQARLLVLGLVDAFRLFEQPEKSYSWWDYREMAFRRNKGLRIDHILVSQSLREQVASCTIDRQPRKNERPSDHAPVIVELADGAQNSA